MQWKSRLKWRARRDGRKQRIGQRCRHAKKEVCGSGRSRAEVDSFCKPWDRTKFGLYGIFPTGSLGKVHRVNYEIESGTEPTSAPTVAQSALGLARNSADGSSVEAQHHRHVPAYAATLRPCELSSAAAVCQRRAAELARHHLTTGAFSPSTCRASPRRLVPHALQTCSIPRYRRCEIKVCHLSRIPVLLMPVL